MTRNAMKKQCSREGEFVKKPFECLQKGRIWGFPRQRRNLLEKHKIFDKKFRIHQISNDQVAIPIFKEKLEEKRNVIDNNSKIICQSHVLLPYSKAHLVKLSSQQKNIVDTIVDAYYMETMKSLSDKDLEDIPNTWQVHGDLLLLPKDSFKHKVWKCVIPAIWDVYCKHLNVKRIARHSRIADDHFRSSKVELLHGVDGKVARKENGILYSYDITKCMFSDGNITEKMRIAKFDCTDEIVVDMFAGIGYFVLPYLVHANARIVYACEWNGEAVKALKNNLEINDVAEKCVVLEGDNREVAPIGIADRINLGLIPSSEESWPSACKALNPSTGGWLHIHANVTSTELYTKRKEITEQQGQTTTAVADLRQDQQTRPANEFSDAQCSSSKNPKDESLCEIFGGGSSTRVLKSKNMTKQEKLECWSTWAEEAAVKIRMLLNEAHNVEGLNDWNCRVGHVEHVKSYAPYIDHIVVDMECRPILT